MKRVLILVLLLVQAPAWATPLTAKWPSDNLLHFTAFWATADRHRDEDPAALSAANPAGRPLIGWDTGPRSMEDAAPDPQALARQGAAAEDPFPSLPNELARIAKAGQGGAASILPGSVPYSDDPLPTARNEWTAQAKPLTYDFPLPQTGWLILLGLAGAIGARLLLSRRRSR